MTYLINQSVSYDGGVYRTALATQGLLIILYLSSARLQPFHSGATVKDKNLYLAVSLCSKRTFI